MRQMGGAYVYSFDIAAMLFGVCFNLSGLPYSAGFLGKEFLLFQVLRDDFLSLFVRGCWLVSFFFTPIYMFMLVFLVMFGTKKGSVVSYRSGWGSTIQQQLASIANYKNSINSLIYASLYRFQFTAVTSRTTSYFLFTFWCFFFFFGEILLLITFNFSTPLDTIASSSFFTIKQHTVFYLNTLSTKLLTHINCYIYFLTSSAFMYLVNLNYAYSYNYFKQSYINSVLGTAVLFAMLIL